MKNHKKNQDKKVHHHNICKIANLIVQEGLDKGITNTRDFYSRVKSCYWSNNLSALVKDMKNEDTRQYILDKWKQYLYTITNRRVLIEFDKQEKADKHQSSTSQTDMIEQYINSLYFPGMPIIQKKCLIYIASAICRMLDKYNISIDYKVLAHFVISIYPSGIEDCELLIDLMKDMGLTTQKYIMNELARYLSGLSILEYRQVIKQLIDTVPTNIDHMDHNEEKIRRLRKQQESIRKNAWIGCTGTPLTLGNIKQKAERRIVIDKIREQMKANRKVQDQMDVSNSLFEEYKEAYTSPEKMNNFANRIANDVDKCCKLSGTFSKIKIMDHVFTFQFSQKCEQTSVLQDIWNFFRLNLIAYPMYFPFVFEEDYFQTEDKKSPFNFFPKVDRGLTVSKQLCRSNNFFDTTSRMMSYSVTDFRGNQLIYLLVIFDREDKGDPVIRLDLRNLDGKTRNIIYDRITPEILYRISTNEIIGIR